MSQNALLHILVSPTQEEVYGLTIPLTTQNS